MARVHIGARASPERVAGSYRGSCWVHEVVDNRLARVTLGPGESQVAMLVRESYTFMSPGADTTGV